MSMLIQVLPKEPKSSCPIYMNEVTEAVHAWKGFTILKSTAREGSIADGSSILG
jgi:hypothetical protein